MLQWFWQLAERLELLLFREQHPPRNYLCQGEPLEDRRLFSGIGVSGSRASDKFSWYSNMHLIKGPDGKWMRDDSNPQNNDIGPVA
jgi:hypothetical protein